MKNSFFHAAGPESGRHTAEGPRAQTEAGLFFDFIGIRRTDWPAGLALREKRTGRSALKMH